MTQPVRTKPRPFESAFALRHYYGGDFSHADLYADLTYFPFGNSSVCGRLPKVSVGRPNILPELGCFNAKAILVSSESGMPSSSAHRGATPSGRHGVPFLYWLCTARYCRL